MPNHTKEILSGLSPDKIYIIDKAAVKMTDLEGAEMQEINLKEATSLSYEEEKTDNAPILFDHDFSIECELKLSKKDRERLEEERREWMHRVAPWTKRNFVKETITHKIEY